MLCIIMQINIIFQKEYLILAFQKQTFYHVDTVGILNSILSKNGTHNESDLIRLICVFMKKLILEYYFMQTMLL